jgi:POT family proton-dependent oligopeptide transporter
VFLCIAIFWLIYDQNADTWIYFANRHTDLQMFPATQVGGHNFSGLIGANQMQAMNPLFIVILTPIFNWIWLRAKRMRGGREVPDTQKMLVGFFIVIVTSVIMVAAAFRAGASTQVTIWWVILATFVITLAELCISPVGLEFAYKQAAPGTKSTVTAAFHLMVFLGDFLGLGLAPFYENGLTPAAYFAILAVLMTATAFIFIPIARRFAREDGARSALGVRS